MASRGGRICSYCSAGRCPYFEARVPVSGALIGIATRNEANSTLDRKGIQKVLADAPGKERRCAGSVMEGAPRSLQLARSYCTSPCSAAVGNRYRKGETKRFLTCSPVWIN